MDRKIEDQWAFTIKDFLNPSPLSIPGYYVQMGEGMGGGEEEAKGRVVVPLEKLLLFRKSVYVYIVSDVTEWGLYCVRDMDGRSGHVHKFVSFFFFFFFFFFFLMRVFVLFYFLFFFGSFLFFFFFFLFLSFLLSSSFQKHDCSC